MSCMHQYERQETMGEQGLVSWFLCRKCNKIWRVFCKSDDHIIIKEFDAS